MVDGGVRFAVSRIIGLWNRIVAYISHSLRFNILIIVLITVHRVK